MPGRLEGKIALIVGAGCVGPGWGNGRASAVAFVREGAKVFAVDRDADFDDRDGAARPGNRRTRRRNPHLHLRHHATGQIGGDGRRRVAAYGRIDILVNNVGGSAKGGVVELSEEAWDHQMDFNLKTVFLTCKHVIPIMEANGGGAIVNTSSGAGVRWTGSAQVGYAASKAGVIQFGKVTAVEYAPKGIRVNTVIPGQMHTPLVEARLVRQRGANDVEALLKSRVARIPLGFMGDGRDIA